MRVHQNIKLFGAKALLSQISTAKQKECALFIPSFLINYMNVALYYSYDFQ
jgi:hypothetical protein